MAVLSSFRDKEIYFHHSLDRECSLSNYSMHTHNYLEIDFVVAGNVQLLVEGSLYEMKAGELLITRASEAHRLIITEQTLYERIYRLQFLLQSLRSTIRSPAHQR